MYLPFQPIRGVQFTLYLVGNDGVNPANSAANTYCGISKDGGQFTETTNPIVFVSTDASDTLATRYKKSVILTATEMDADVIIVSLRDSAVGATSCESCIIYTATNQLATAPTLNSSIADKITAIFQYLFFRRTVTTTQEKLYKADGLTVVGTGTISDNGTTFDKGAPV